MNAIQEIEALLALREKAPQLEALCDESGFAHWWIPDGGTVPIEFDPVPRNDSPQNPYAPYTFTGATSGFICASANATEALRKLLAVAEAAEKIGASEIARHNRDYLTEAECAEVDTLYDALDAALQAAKEDK